MTMTETPSETIDSPTIIDIDYDNLIFYLEDLDDDNDR